MNTPNPHRVDAAAWWLSQLSDQLYRFVTTPSQAQLDALTNLCNQYRSAVEFKQVEPPRIFPK